MNHLNATRRFSEDYGGLVPIIAHAADFLPLIPIPIAVIALVVYSRRQRRLGDRPPDEEQGGLAAVADMTLLGVRTLRDRFRGKSEKDQPKKS